MNPDLNKLQPYPFERLNQLKSGITPPAELNHIALSIGEPKHPAPAFVRQEITDQLDSLSGYPNTKGITELRSAIAQWAEKRFNLKAESLNPESNVLPCNGTREALFAITQAIIDRTAKTQPKVICPNPFYQIYEGAAYLAGAKPYFLNCMADNNFLPDYDSVPEHVWQQCQLLFVCSPGNPTGAVTSLEQFQKLIALADKYDFTIAADECYSEIYFDEARPPVGLLEACAELGRHDYRRCLVFHSLSKRSNLPGLRSGFIAGDAEILSRFLLYRTYHGCAMPLYSQHASIKAWADEEHVVANRDLYREKFDAVLQRLNGVLEVSRPDAGFYLWAKTPVDDETFARELFAQQNITVLAGSYLSREQQGKNPGDNRIRMALVAPLEECIEAAERISRFVATL
ncbi:succinyldiaminopimelate transaminase [Motiliproteus sp. MSK22-1]|uniref:succinyldiaminopimelate transaminase n=1 Tax=Motiliproteus sp. MSK22-1 TaxID=1897630 RepID=UPI0009774276|nr:succinyldiaminopimelate transaminase [Motiliproteus sp. MSK22-1]OMH39156.1 succinyldiaminopimelate transaminase [Motiliproteus sp. MSK22-1]